VVIVKRRVISYLIVLDSRDGMTENLNHCRVVHVVLRRPCMLVREKVLLFILLCPVFVIIWRIISPLCLRDLFLLMIILLPSLFGFYGTLVLLSLCFVVGRCVAFISEHFCWCYRFVTVCGVRLF